MEQHAKTSSDCQASVNEWDESQNGLQDYPSEQKGTGPIGTEKDKDYGRQMWNMLYVTDVSDDDIVFALPFLSNWSSLSHQLAHTQLSTRALMVLLQVEASNKRRPPILQRLIGAVSNSVRREFRAAALKKIEDDAQMLLDHCSDKVLSRIR